MIEEILTFKHDREIAVLMMHMVLQGVIECKLSCPPYPTTGASPGKWGGAGVFSE